MTKYVPENVNSKSGISPPHIELMQIFGGCFPFLTMVFIAMIIPYSFPEVVFWLPNLVYGN